jgi:hypothetical protein
MIRLFEECKQNLLAVAPEMRSNPQVKIPTLLPMAFHVALLLHWVLFVWPGLAHFPIFWRAF